MSEKGLLCWIIWGAGEWLNNTCLAFVYGGTAEFLLLYPVTVKKLANKYGYISLLGMNFSTEVSLRHKLPFGKENHYRGEG